MLYLTLLNKELPLFWWIRSPCPQGVKVPSPSESVFGFYFHGVSPSFIPFLMPWSHKALKEEKKPLEVGRFEFSAGNSGCGEESVVTANSYFVVYRSRSSGKSFCRDCLEESHGLNLPVNIWGLGTELLWARWKQWKEHLEGFLNPNMAFLPHLVGTQCIEPGVCCILIPALSFSTAARSPWFLFCLLAVWAIIVCGKGTERGGSHPEITRALFIEGSE